MATKSYGLGVITADKAIESTVQLSAEEFEALRRASGSLDKLTYDFSWSQLCTNYRAMCDIFKYHELLYAVGRNVRSNPSTRNEATLYSAVVNWLTAVHFFLDHAESEASRRYGANSDQAAQLEAATNAAYDGRFGYRFCYRLRNFYLHVGVPPFSEHRSMPTANDPPWVKEHFSLLLDRDELVARWKGWSSVKADILEMDQRFEFVPLVHDAMDGLAEVHTTQIRLRIESVLPQLDVLEDARRRLAESDMRGSPIALSRSEPDSPEESIKLQPVPLPLAEAAQLRRAVAQADALDDIIKVRRPTVDHTSWSSNIWHGAINKSTVGSRLLLRWLESGEFDEEYAKAVRAELQQPNGLQEVINGLTFVGGVLTSMVASLLGTDRRVLLQDLASIPRDANDEKLPRQQSAE
jgi:hypothetical protein